MCTVKQVRELIQLNLVLFTKRIWEQGCTFKSAQIVPQALQPVKNYNAQLLVPAWDKPITLDLII